jgi:hypothetical protein
MRAPLEIYLNDHLAGSDSALALLRRLVRKCRTMGSGRTLRDLMVEIQADQRTLEAVMRSVGVAARPVRRRIARPVGALLALRNHAIAARSSPEFELFQGLEMLALGIAGKRSLWRALGAIAAGHAALQRVNFAELEDRAERQIADVQKYQRSVAPAALGSVRFRHGGWQALTPNAGAR